MWWNPQTAKFKMQFIFLVFSTLGFDFFFFFLFYKRLLFGINILAIYLSINNYIVYFLLQRRHGNTYWSISLIFFFFLIIHSPLSKFLFSNVLLFSYLTKIITDNHIVFFFFFFKINPSSSIGTKSRTNHVANQQKTWVTSVDKKSRTSPTDHKPLR